METKITIHRALSQLKTTKSRIDTFFEEYAPNKTKRKPAFVATKISKNGLVNGVSEDMAVKKIQGEYDKINALIKNYTVLKNGIILSNAGITDKTDATTLHLIPMGDQNMSVSGIITLRQFILPLKRMLLQIMQQDYRKTVNDIETYNERVSDRCDEQLKAMSGGDKNVLKAAEMKSYSTAFHENNDMFMVDPLKLSEKIDKLKAEIDQLEIETDAILSESNALRTITVNLE